ncbi:MAG: 6,7-dimethyl-8-ribityllumazine synthase [Gemmatimonadetes bacterium]|nr:6,7-dimethyl-8-ribityllumazine synthase [Gemmatimonadota bacterium]
MSRTRGAPTGEDRRVCILVSRFNLIVTDRLLEGARDALIEHGVREIDIEVVSVPGAWELPAAARAASDRGYDAIVALGCVIRGETAHFDHVSRAAVDGLARVQHESGVPVGLGILTPEDMTQAMARAGGDVGHAGVQAAEAALEMADLLERLRAD